MKNDHQRDLQCCVLCLDTVEDVNPQVGQEEEGSVHDKHVKQGRTDSLVPTFDTAVIKLRSGHALSHFAVCRKIDQKSVER